MSEYRRMRIIKDSTGTIDESALNVWVDIIAVGRVAGQYVDDIDVGRISYTECYVVRLGDEIACWPTHAHGQIYEFEDPQPNPIANDHPSAHDKVMTDIAERKAHGIRKYQTTLQPGNGRDSLEDAYAEALDLTAYLANELMERELKGDDVPQ